MKDGFKRGVYLYTVAQVQWMGTGICRPSPVMHMYHSAGQTFDCKCYQDDARL